MAWTLIKQGGEGYNSTEHKEWMVDASTDVTVTTNIPENDGDAGSIAYLPDLSSIWQRDASGAWHALG